MTDTVSSIVSTVDKTVIPPIEADAVKAWDEFLAGVHWLEAEATKIYDAVKTLDPAIQSAAQTLIADGETAAAKLASQAYGAMTNVVSATVADAETLMANYVQAAGGGSTLGQTASAALVQILQDGASVLATSIPVVVARLLSEAVAAVTKP